MVSSTRGRIRNDESRTVRFPEVDGIPSDRAITFLHRMSYLPSRDDDFSFRFEPQADRMIVSASKGNSSSEVSFELKTWALPESVQVFRQNLVLEGRKDRSSFTFDVPEGRGAVAFLECLEYTTGADDDLSFAARSFAVGPQIVTVALSDFGNEDSRVVLRATVLHWPETLATDVRVTRLVAAPSGADDSIAFAAGEGTWIATPTMYLTDTTKFKYSELNDPDKLLDALNASSEAGRKIDLFGIVRSGTLVAGEIFDQAGNKLTTTKIIERTFDFVERLIKANADQRDDDFFLRTTVDSANGGGADTVVKAEIGDGNDFSLGEVTVWSLAFPS